MPELPEVELHRRHLEKWLAGRTVVDVEVRPAGLLDGNSAQSLKKRLKNVTFEKPVRVGKHIAVPSTKGGALYLHLGMTGNFSRRKAGEPEPRFRALSLFLDDDRVVDFTDARRFGTMGWLAGDDVRAAPPFNALGRDLLDDPPGPKEFLALLSTTKRPVKIALMEQSLVAGLGNIHAAEALWRAKIHPERPANSLGVDEVKRLLTGIRQTFKLVLDDDDGESLAYVEQGAVNPFKIYDRDGEKCPRCKRATIGKFTQGGRSTYVCPVCQPLPKARKRS